MVEAVTAVQAENEVDQLAAHFRNGENVLLSGGAGSGKTYSLVRLIDHIFQINPLAAVRCITFTNVAVEEIRSRLAYKNLQVSTIHDFLWDCICLYQKNLKTCLVALVNNNSIKHSFAGPLPSEYFNDRAIEYKDWTKLAEGVISHNEIILLSKEMFTRFPLLGKLISDRFNYILVDEYQDTAPEVITILLDLLPQIGNRCIIGFFGDAMQAIYDGTVGNITSYVQQGRVREVLKQDNRRNPQPVIELANQLRNDAVIQQLATDSQAPNFGQQGSIRFFYSTTGDVEAIKHHPYFQHWDFADTAQTKELYLTHNLIAAKAQFSCLSDIYDKDRIIEYKSVLQSIIRETGMDVEGFSFGDVINAIGKKPSKTQQAFFEANPELFTRACQTPWAVLSKIYLDKNQLIGTRKGSEEEQNRKGTQRDALITHLYGLQECLHFYNTGQYRQLIRKNKLRINSIEDKKHLKRSIGLLNEMKAASIEEVIQVAHDTGVYYKTEKLLQFIAEKEYVYNRVKELPYLNIFNFYHFVEGYTPFSTQHNVKGAEFNNVLVVLDNGNWNNYNFEYLFCNTGNPNVLERTRKIFYVCCTRTKKNLAVYYHKPIPAVIEQAQRWFGPQNVISLS